MKKPLFLILVVMLLFAGACKPSSKSVSKIEQPKVAVTSDVVDSVGNDLNNIEKAQKDLSGDALSDFGFSLDDIQKI